LDKKLKDFQTYLEQEEAKALSRELRKILQANKTGGKRKWSFGKAVNINIGTSELGFMMACLKVIINVMIAAKLVANCIGFMPKITRMTF